MAYVTFEDFNGMYPGEISVEEFKNLEWDARRVVDAHTTGVDNVRKLRVAFPEDADDAEAVLRCMCTLINLMHKIGAVEKHRGLELREDGMVRGGVVSSVSSGSESISYATGGTAIDAAVSSISERNKLYSQIVKHALSGVCDANGVHLLYMGVYPYVC